MKSVSIKTRVMDFVAGRGEASYTDIIKFIVEEVKGWTWNRTLHRGYYSSALSKSDGKFYNSSNKKGYFLRPTQNEKRYLKKNETTKKYYIVKAEKGETKNIQEKEYSTKELYDKFTEKLFKNDEKSNFQITDFDFLVKVWNTFFSSNGTIERVDESAGENEIDVFIINFKFINYKVALLNKDTREVILIYGMDKDEDDLFYNIKNTKWCFFNKDGEKIYSKATFKNVLDDVIKHFMNHNKESWEENEFYRLTLNHLGTDEFFESKYNLN